MADSDPANVMSSRRMERAAAFVLVALVATCAAVLLAACRGPSGDRAPPMAVDGRLDLRAWDFASDGPAPLDGQWHLAWDALVPPGEPLPDALPAAVPGHWTTVERGGVFLPNTGQATYRLTLLLPPGQSLLALRVPPVRTAFRLYAGERLLARGGHIGDGPDDVTPAYAPQTAFLDKAGQRVELTVQVANAHHRSGGLFRSFSVGTPDDVLAGQSRATGSDYLLCGAIFVMAIYHLGLFAVRRRERAPLYFALYCLVVCIRLPLTGHLLFFEAFPEADLRVMLRVEYSTFALGSPLFAMFLASLFPKTWHRVAIQIIVGVGALFLGLIWLVPIEVATRLPLLMTAFTTVGGTYCAYTLVRAIRMGREGAALFAAGFLLQCAALANDTLYSNGLSTVTTLVPHATFVFVFIQSFVLSRRFASAYAMAESYASTFRKFVPTQFLRRIAKEGLSSIRLGNVEADDITILFSDIRSFTTISERLAPDEVFSMLNAYLSRMEPPIQAHGGFVDKYIGDAIMALFDRETRQQSAEGAVEAGLGMLEVLEGYNATLAAEGRPTFRTGIGIHSGEVMIGTVGSDHRMDSTAIGDAVNLAARIEGMTKMYGANLLVSEHTVAALGEARSRYALRFVDRVRVKGKQQPVAVWEVLGHLDDPRIARIEPHLPGYVTALELYLARDFERAAVELRRFLEVVPDDIPAALHLDRCHQFAGGVTDDWDGVVSLQTK